MADETPSGAEAYNQTQAQLDAIEQEIKATQPLTTEQQDLAALKPQYEAKYFLLGIDELAQKYAKIRQTRGDGNCYYRSFLYSLSEKLLEDTSERSRVLKYVKESNQFVTSVGGYSEMAIDMFYESLVEFLEGLSSASAMHKELIEENATSDYCTWYLRVLTATFLKSDPLRFEPYLEDGYYDIATFCQREIEPMGRECSMIQVIALAEAFQVQVAIEYLDGREFHPKTKGGSGLTVHSFGPESATTRLTLLYRPGHYDILYLK